MTRTEARAILCEMQKWRRSEPPYDGDDPTWMPHSHQEFGQAIDVAIESLEE